MNRDSKKYYKDIKAIFPSIGKNEKRLLTSYRDRIIELNEANPDLSYADLTNTLGTPVEIITEYYEGAHIDYLMKRLRTTKLLRNSVYITLLVIFFALFISLGFNIKLYHQANDSIIIRENTTIE